MFELRCSMGLCLREMMVLIAELDCWILLPLLHVSKGYILMFAVADELSLRMNSLLILVEQATNRTYNHNRRQT